MKIEHKKLADIKPYAKNPRENSRTVEALVVSIPKYGFNVPIVVDSKGVIICGHARYAAAQQLKLKVVPVVVSDLSPAKAKKYRIADNKIQELTEWNQRDLIVEMRELPSFDKIPGFTEGEVGMYTRMFADSTSVPQIATPTPIQYVKGADGINRRVVPMSNVQIPVARRDVTSDAINQSSEKVLGNFERKDVAYRGNLVAIDCKCCGRKFTLLRSDIERM